MACVLALDQGATSSRAILFVSSGKILQRAQKGVFSRSGSDAIAIRDMMRHHYVEAEVIWAARWGWARTVGDVLSRRTRALLLNTRAALDIAPRVAEFLGTELGRDTSWKE